MDSLTRDFVPLPDLIRAHARARPHHIALIQDGRKITYAVLDEWLDRVACALERDGAGSLDAVAICAATTMEYVAIFLGSLRAGIAVAPLPISATAPALAAMVVDAGAKVLFLDRAAMNALRDLDSIRTVPRVGLEDSGSRDLQSWMAAPGSVPAAVDLQPHWPFNIIYSSGTTGAPKGIVQPHSLRWSNVERSRTLGYGPESVTLLATPLYSNTTLGTLFGALGTGGTVVLMAKFSAPAYLALAEQCRATHTILVPVQYLRLLAEENFDRHDLSSFQLKFSTGAPFAAELKRRVLERWPGGLVEIYGLTEGGGACLLEAHKHPDKLHTVGMPMPRHDIRLIDAAGQELPCGEVGEIVGHSPAMMSGYLNQPAKTREAEWHDASGKRFIRSGDVGRFDSDGFLVLLDRKKDMIISGGFNVYPSDLESVLREHPEVEEAAVIGLDSSRWGETPAACVVLKPRAAIDAEQLMVWANARLGKTQRLAAVKVLAGLPRNAAGKVLKRQLREEFGRV